MQRFPPITRTATQSGRADKARIKSTIANWTAASLARAARESGRRAFHADAVPRAREKPGRKTHSRATVPRVASIFFPFLPSHRVTHASSRIARRHRNDVDCAKSAICRVRACYDRHSSRLEIRIPSRRRGKLMRAEFFFSKSLRSSGGGRDGAKKKKKHREKKIAKLTETEINGGRRSTACLSMPRRLLTDPTLNLIRALVKEQCCRK